MENKLLFETWLRIPPPNEPVADGNYDSCLLSVKLALQAISTIRVISCSYYVYMSWLAWQEEEERMVVAWQLRRQYLKYPVVPLTDIQTRHRDIILFETSGRFIHGRKKRVFLTRHDNEFQLFFLATEPGTAKNMICSYIWWIRFLCPTLTIPRAQRYHITLKTWGQPYVPTCLGHFQN